MWVETSVLGHTNMPAGTGHHTRPSREPIKFAQAYLALIKCLSFCLAPLTDVIILGLDFGDDAVQVQSAVVVHGQDDIGVSDSLL